MNAQHTPGPWTVVDVTSQGTMVYRRIDAGKSVGFAGAYKLKDQREAEANARLIAAAPELLRLAYQYLSDLRYPPTGESLDRRIEEARRVILNALGDA